LSRMCSWCRRPAPGMLPAKFLPKLDIFCVVARNVPIPSTSNIVPFQKRDVLKRIRSCGTVPLDYGSESCFKMFLSKFFHLFAYYRTYFSYIYISLQLYNFSWLM
jgi:hypothetical protein